MGGVFWSAKKRLAIRILAGCRDQLAGHADFLGLTKQLHLEIVQVLFDSAWGPVAHRLALRSLSRNRKNVGSSATRFSLTAPASLAILILTFSSHYTPPV